MMTGPLDKINAAFAEINRIARAELEPKRKYHRHNWQTDENIKAQRAQGLKITFTCSDCGKRKVV